MKPMGTITKYYPFIEEDDKVILNQIMDEATSYFDFAHKICNLVVRERTSDNLAYIAAIQAWWCRLVEAMNAIQTKYGEVSYIRPWGYLHSTVAKDQEEYHDRVVESIEEAIESSQPDWIVIELHLLHAFFHYPFHGDIPSLIEPLEKAKVLVESNPLLNCFESLIDALEAWAMGLEGEGEEVFNLLRRGRKLAEEYDDSLYKYTNLLFLGDFLTSRNVQEGIEQFEELYEFTQELQVPYYIGETLNDSSLAFETAGEYDLAISCHLEVIKIRGSKDFTSQLLSRIYASLGDASRALEEANYFLEYTAGTEISTGYLRKARALALLNRIDEAEQLLDKANVIIMKSGSDIVLGTYYHVAGVIELAKGNYLDALDILEKSWEVYEKIHRIHCQNYVLLDLARAEFLFAKESKECINLTVPRRWLSQLERHASNLNLPGIQMQAAMLKSKFYQENNQLKDAEAILEDALKISDSAGVLTLKKMISARIKELDQLMHDAEIA